MKTIVPLSGGLDSATVLATCIKDGDITCPIFFNYGQPHLIEQKYAAQIAAHYDRPLMGVELPRIEKIDDVVFPGRNLWMASICISAAQQMGYDRIAFGCNASDWPRFPDCRPEFWRNVARCAEAYGVGVLTPLIYMSKRDVVEAARKLGVPIELTWSCYSPREGEPCRECLACKTREEALQ